MKFAWLAALTVCGALAFARGASGAPGERVALVGIQANVPLARQLMVELKALGFEVLATQIAPDTEPVVEFKRLAVAERLAAILHVTSIAPPRIDIFVVDERATDQDGGRLLKLSIDTTDSDPAARVVALRTIEILRATMRQLAEPRLQPKPPPAPIPAPERHILPPPRPARRVSRIAFGAGGAVAASPGGIGVAPALNIVVKVWPFRSWGISALAFTALGRAEVSGTEGSAAVHYVLVGAGPSFRLRPSAGAWQLDVSVGVGSAVFSMEGNATAPFTGEADSATSFATYGSLALGFYVAEHLSIVSSLVFGSLIPEVEVRFAERVAGTWGSVYGAGTLGLNVEF